MGFDPVVVECDEAVADYDGDGMAAIIEARLGTDPRLADSDGDGIDDYWEVVAGLDPLVDDAADDPDGDGRTNLEEYLNSGYFYTNPLNPDTDGDGLCDGVTSVMSGETVLCGPGEGDSATPELDAARLRLLAESAIGELTLGDGDTWSDELEEGDTLKLSVAGALDAGTYTVRFDNGSRPRVTKESPKSFLEKWTSGISFTPSISLLVGKPSLNYFSPAFFPHSRVTPIGAYIF